MRHPDRPTRGPLEPADREKIDALRNLKGEKRAARLVGVSKFTLARAAAGFPLLQGTRLLITTRLAALEQRPGASS